ncbi:MAG TPA: hypothetical protein DD381_06050 [Lentisphaeria bacterium]|nr:MAG: hypothetical protein A2X47_14055 [Lentisphaerae bacterium GWF2_38_69]HBM15888.1 hypothetical protein [Lentisphaeria bacterium]
MNCEAGIIVSSIGSLSVIITLAVLYAFIAKSIIPIEKLRSITTGFLYGLMCMIIPMAGVFCKDYSYTFDGMPIIVSTAGIIGGLWGGIVSCVIGVTYKILIETSVVWSDISVIAIAAIFGIVFFFLRKKYEALIKPASVLLFVYILYGIIALGMIFLNRQNPDVSFENLILPMLIFFPIANFFLIILLDNLDKIFLSHYDLKKLSSNLQEANKIANLGQWEFNVINNRLSWTEEVFRIFEIINRPARITYEYFLRFVHPEDVARLEETYVSSLREKKLFEIEHRITTETGKLKFVHERCENFYDQKGNPICSIGMVMDITDQILREQLIKKLFMQSINAVSNALEKKDPYTRHHQRQVANLAVQVGMEMGYDKDRLIGLYIASLVHDIGKVAIPNDILEKTAPLTTEEYRIIREHPTTGYEIFNDFDSRWPIKEIIYQHHEKLDGSGYPRGLKGDAILEEARIISVCDTFEAIVNDRPYRQKLSVDSAIKVLRDGMKVSYDKKICSILIAFIEKEKVRFDTLPPEFDKIYNDYLYSY